MKFSVIVPIYNVELYLADCLDSILNQTFHDYEIICINDASTDRSYDILSRYAEKHRQIKVIINKNNAGPSYSRNRGIENADGEYILFLDSDDMLRSDALAILNETVKENDVEVVYYRYLVKNEGEKAKEQNITICDQIVFDKNIKTGQQRFIEMAQKDWFMMSACFCLYKKAYLIDYDLSFYEGIVYEDVISTLQFLLYATKVSYIHEFIYIHRRRDNSITTTISEYYLDSYIVVLGEILALWKSSKLEVGMDDAIGQYVRKIIPAINKLCSLYPEHQKMKIGTSADQFIFDLFRGTITQHFYYIHLTEQDMYRIRLHDKIIIFGAGTVATELITYLRMQQIKIEAVAVSDKSMNNDEIAGIKIYQIDDLLWMREEALVIIGVINHNQGVISQKLKSLDFKNVMCIDTDKNAVEV